MKTEYPNVEWLLDCEPRIVQLEATARSYTGKVYRNRANDPMPSVARWLKHIGAPAKGWGHLLEMRLGKTPILLNEFQLFRRDYSFRRLVIISPNQYKTSWASEAQKFGIELPIHTYETRERSKAKDFIAKNKEFMLIFNYEALQHKSNMSILVDAIDDRTLLGADESVIIKNRQSIMTKNALDLSKRAAAVRILTGKPTPQGVHDLYSQLRFIRKLNGMNFFQFRNTFAKMGGFQSKQVTGVKNEDMLRDWAQDWYFFARRTNWGTSLDSNYEIVNVGMSSEQQKHYEQMEEEFITWLNDGQEVTADQAITKHIKLQQISSGFLIDEFGNPNQIVPMDRVPKFKELKDRLNNYMNGKCLVIAHFNSTINALVEALNEYDPAVIRGNVHMKRDGRITDDEKHRFNTDPNCRVLIGQSQAIKYGHTLRGEEGNPCLDTIYFENSYSLDDRAQSEQRNQGEGQLAAINIQDLCSSKAEYRVIQALQKKEKVASVIMGYYRGE